MTFGEKLKHIREDILFMTQAELASSIGFTQGAINNIETDKNKKGSFDLFQQMVVVHGVNPYYFIYDKSNEPPILKRNGTGTKPLLTKISKYEKLIEQLNEVKKGKQ